MTPPDDYADESALVLAAQRGSREAFGLLVSRHAASVLGLARRMLGPTAEAEDAAQETFVSAFKALAGFRSQARFSTWLYRIAANKCRDALRTRRPDVLSFESFDLDLDGARWEPADTDTPHGIVEQEELADELDQSIQALPPLYRESFILRHVEGLDYDEMSEVLGVNRDTLKMRVYKARTLLCRSLAHLTGAQR